MCTPTEDCATDVWLSNFHLGTSEAQHDCELGFLLSKVCFFGTIDVTRKQTRVHRCSVEKRVTKRSNVSWTVKYQGHVV